MNVVLVIPCYNEAKRLNTQTFLAEKNIKFVFVDDGSQDETLTTLDQFKKYGHKVVSLKNNLGKSEAVRQGMLTALNFYPQADWIGYWDADLATPLDQVQFMLNFCQISGECYEGIFGSRVLRLGSSIDRFVLRHFMGRIFITYASFLLGSHTYDSQCGAKLFKKKIIQEIFRDAFVSRWFFDLEIIQRLAINKIQILECPIQTWHDVEGSKVQPLVDGLKALIEIIKIRNVYGKIKNIK